MTSSERLPKRSYLRYYPRPKAQDFDRRIGQKESMTTPELRRYITNEIRKGAPMIEFYQVELHRRTAIPFATYILTTIGLAIPRGACAAAFGLAYRRRYGIECLIRAVPSDFR